MKIKKLKQKQDELRRFNKASIELARVGGYMDRAEKLLSVQHLLVSLVVSYNAALEETLERANLKTTKTISIQNALLKSTDAFYKLFDGAMERETVLNWAEDLDRLEIEVSKFAGIKQFRPKRKAMQEAKPALEEKYNIILNDLI